MTELLIYLFVGFVFSYYLWVAAMGFRIYNITTVALKVWLFLITTLLWPLCVARLIYKFVVNYTKDDEP